MRRVLTQWTMLYAMDNMPESMKGAPKQAMEIFIAAFNTAFEKNHVEGAAMAIAMSAVHKAGYKKDEQGNWMEIRNPKSEIRNHAEWIPIFRTGTHTDSQGNEKTWTEGDLDVIVSKYKPAEHEAPEVIGHPEHNAPAWGWVEGLKREGQTLFAKMKNRVPEFVDMVRKGLFKKRSISLYPDMTLRHVGWLGAMPPAVKGLPDVAFNEAESIVIEFGEIGTVIPKSEIRNPKSFFGKEAKGMKWFDWLKGKAEAEGVALEDAPQSFAEGGNPKSEIPNPQLIKALVDAEVAKVVAAKTAEFAEEGSKLKTESDRLKAENEKLEKAKGERKKADIASFCEGLCEEGKLTPAMMKYGMGMTNFLEAISGIETTIEFSEGTEKKKQTPVEYAKSFLSAFKKQIEFGEFAGNEKDIPRGNDKRDAAIRDYQEKNKKDGVEITYKEAVLAVSKAQPELFKG
mgnify:FL=1